MKLTVQKPTEINVDAIRCILPVRFGTEDIPQNFYGRDGDMLTLTLDIESRKIRGWLGNAARCYLKVCDGGIYELLDGDAVVATIEDTYTPRCIPQEWGDYINFNIAQDGTLVGWVPDADDIHECFFT